MNERMKRLVRRMIKQQLNEGGFLRVHRMLLGMVPQVDEMAIFTAWNPNAEQLPRSENNQRNKELFRDLKAAGYGPIKIKGKFGNFERSFLVPNMSKSNVVEMGQQYGQEAVIWGAKAEDESGAVKIIFQYLEDGRVQDARDVVLVGKHEDSEGEIEDVQAKEDYYSEKAGRKFVIPFFDENWEFELDADSTNEILLRESVPETLLAKELLQNIEERKVKLAVPNASKKYYWHHRCIMRENVRRLKKLTDSYNSLI
jgi:hypothetical protein